MSFLFDAYACSSQTGGPSYTVLKDGVEVLINNGLYLDIDSVDFDIMVDDVEFVVEVADNFILTGDKKCTLEV